MWLGAWVSSSRRYILPATAGKGLWRRLGRAQRVEGGLRLTSGVGSRAWASAPHPAANLASGGSRKCARGQGGIWLSMGLVHLQRPGARLWEGPSGARGMPLNLLFPRPTAQDIWFRGKF